MNLSDGEFLLSLEEQIISNVWSRQETKRLWQILGYTLTTAHDRRFKLRTEAKRRKFLDRAAQKIVDKVSARLDPTPEKSIAKKPLQDLFYTQTISKQTLMEMHVLIDKASRT